jgi:hypothetical protein
MNAFAGKHMVTLSGYEGGNTQDRSLDFTHTTGSNNPNEMTRNLALNYAYSVTDAVQVGLVYKNYKYEEGGDVQPGDDRSSVTMGLQAIYNFANQTSDTNYLGLKYTTQQFEESDNNSDDDKVTTWSLEFGHRFSLGTIWGMNFNYSPSASLAFEKTAFEAANTDDESTTSVALNFVKFDVLF